MRVGSRVRSSQGTFEVSVHGANAHLAALHARTEKGRPYFVGVPGDGPTFLVRNLTSSPGFVVCGVDGMNVCHNEKARSESRFGLVIAPHETLPICGWQTEEGTRAFVLWPSGDDACFATQANGTDSGLGVIGFAIRRPIYSIRSSQYPRPSYDYNPYCNGDMLKSGGSTRGLGGFNTGLGMAAGGIVDAPHAERDDRCDGFQETTNDTAVIGYGLEEVLQAMGIVVPDEPVAFPGDSQTGYETYRTVG